jgi:hypothetical protein
MVLESDQPTINRLNRSMMATRYMYPPATVNGKQKCSKNGNGDAVKMGTGIQ